MHNQDFFHLIDRAPPKKPVSHWERERGRSALDGIGGIDGRAGIAGSRKRKSIGFWEKAAPVAVQPAREGAPFLFAQNGNRHTQHGQQRQHASRGQLFASPAASSSGSAKKSSAKWLVLAAFVVFVVGFLAGFPLGRFLTLDEQIVRYPDGSPNPQLQKKLASTPAAVAAISSPSAGHAAGHSAKKIAQPETAGSAISQESQQLAPASPASPASAAASSSPASPASPASASGVQFTNQSNERAYIIRVGKYAPEDMMVIQTGLRNLFSSKNTHPCQQEGAQETDTRNGKPLAREVLFVSPGREAEAAGSASSFTLAKQSRQIFVGCFADLNTAKDALKKIRVFSTSPQIFQLKD